MSIRGHLFAAVYDRVTARTEAECLAGHRAALLSGATGRVLEIGGGTGANLAYYGPGVERLTVTEPEPALVRLLTRRAQEAGRDAVVLRAPAEDLPFDDATFDTVVSTLVLCSVEDQRRAAGELWRVLRPGGRLLFVEHVRSQDAELARRQDRMNRFNRIVAGCDCNRPTLDTLRATGFALGDVVHAELTGAPAFSRPLVVGTAVAATASA